MKKYLPNQQDCIKDQLEDEHIVIIQLDSLPKASDLNNSHHSVISSDNKTPTHLTFSLLPASTRVH